jgi:hypothetical protein
MSCPGCLIKKDKKGRVRYSHQIVQAAIIADSPFQFIAGDRTDYAAKI